MISENLLEIIRADKKARDKVNEVVLSEENAAQSLEETRAGFEEIYKQKALDRIQEAETAYSAAYQKAAKDADRRFEETKTQLAVLYQTKKEEWVEDLIKSVTSC